MGGTIFPSELYAVVRLGFPRGTGPRRATRVALWRALLGLQDQTQEPLTILALTEFVPTRWEDVRPEELLQRVQWYVGTRLQNSGTPEDVITKASSVRARLEAAPPALKGLIGDEPVHIMAAVNLTSYFRHVDDEDMDPSDDDEDDEDDEDDDEAGAKVSSRPDAEERAADNAIFLGRWA